MGHPKIFVTPNRHNRLGAPFTTASPSWVGNGAAWTTRRGHEWGTRNVSNLKPLQLSGCPIHDGFIVVGGERSSGRTILGAPFIAPFAKSGIASVCVDSGVD
jgi:hypothetical protein